MAIGGQVNQTLYPREPDISLGTDQRPFAFLYATIIVANGETLNLSGLAGGASGDIPVSSGTDSHGNSTFGHSHNLQFSSANVLKIGDETDKIVDWYGFDKTLAVVGASGTVYQEGTSPTVQAFGHRGTPGVPTASQAGDHIFTIFGAGADSETDPADSAMIVAIVDDTPSAGIIPGKWVHSTADATGVMTERLLLDSKGGAILPEEHANGADPAAPTAGGRLYMVQTAGGKTQLAVRFPSGDPQIIATEP